MDQPSEGMDLMEQYKKANQALWNEWARIHARSEFYDVDSFKAGRSTLGAFELEELGDVTGKSLLHLQCHFGMDTLSWARRGARVTGVDFSDEAIELAESLNAELDIDAEFVCSDILELPSVLQGEYDIVYTSYGVLTWLPDLERWAQVISHFLKPGGVFYMAEFHPFAMVFDDENPSALSLRYPYFHRDEPMAFEVQGSYADREARTEQKVEYEWIHSMGDVLNALINAGLNIQFLHEFSFCVYEMLPGLMEQGEDGLWRLKEKGESLPLMFSLKARKA